MNPDQRVFLERALEDEKNIKLNLHLVLKALGNCEIT